MKILDENEIDGRIFALKQQRESALDQIVLMQGVLYVKEAQIRALEERVKELENGLPALERGEQQPAL